VHSGWRRRQRSWSAPAKRRGIYIRNGEALEGAAGLNVVVFDKTGTITEGRPVVTDFLPAANVDRSRLLAIIAAAEAGSEHLLGRAIAAWCTAQAIVAAECSAFTAIPGRDVRAICEHQTVLIGNSALLAEAGITLVGGDVGGVAATIELSRRTMRIVRQNLFWALGYNVVAIPVAAAGRLSPMIASAAMR